MSLSCKFGVRLRRSAPMKFRVLLLSSILAAGVTLLAQTPASSTQPAANQTQPAADQNQQVQPATSQTPPAADQTQQTQPATDTEQDQAQPADKTDKASDKDKKKGKNSKAKHGGKDDVEAIGNRKVTGMDWYSIETEIRMGKEYATQIETSLKLVNDPVINEYVNRVGQNLVRNSDAKVPFTIK